MLPHYKDRLVVSTSLMKHKHSSLFYPSFSYGGKKFEQQWREAEFVTYLREHEQQLHIVFASLDENKDGKRTIPATIRAPEGLSIFGTRWQHMFRGR